MPDNSRARVVLVVDDDAAVRGALRFALEVEGFQVRDYDGPVALLADRNVPPLGCLVIDYRMPVMDGLELIAVLRERGIGAPAIIISGRPSKDLEAQAMRLGVRQVLEKPLADGALVAAVRSALSSARTAEEPKAIN
jgi:two-component system, LuxR family, response regulator FixJ